MTTLKMKNLNKWVMAVALSAATFSPAMAATEIDESEFGPTYETMMTDAVVGKPLGALAVVAGAAAWVVSLPFTIATGDVEQARQKLIEEPYYAMDRCLGCTPAEDTYYKSLQPVNDNVVRFVVDGPSEVLINTDQHVIVQKP